MEQALINIVKNAIEAIDGKGTIEFTTTTQPLRLIITDTGKGIAKEHSEHLFRPFFSTKKMGRVLVLGCVARAWINSLGT